MNELQIKRYINRIIKLGVDKHSATEIAQVSIELSNGKNIDSYINYALSIKYGWGDKLYVDRYKA